MKTYKKVLKNNVGIKITCEGLVPLCGSCPMVDVIGPSTIGNSLFPAGGKRCVEEILVVAGADAQVTKVVDDGVDG